MMLKLLFLAHQTSYVCLLGYCTSLTDRFGQSWAEHLLEFQEPANRPLRDLF
jgi:hypothetical protein